MKFYLRLLFDLHRLGCAIKHKCRIQCAMLPNTMYTDRKNTWKSQRMILQHVDRAPTWTMCLLCLSLFRKFWTIQKSYKVLMNPKIIFIYSHTKISLFSRVAHCQRWFMERRSWPWTRCSSIGLISSDNNGCLLLFISIYRICAFVVVSCRHPRACSWNFFL